MSASIRIDLSSLPLPDVVMPLDFEAELLSMKNELLAEDPDLAEALDLESETLVKLLQIVAYRLINKTNHVNQTAKALLLAYATSTTLDHIGAAKNLVRLVIKEGDPNAVPPTDTIYESDDSFRRRIQLEPQKDSAGSEGAYLFWALSATGDVRDVSIITSEAGHVQVWVQSHANPVANTALLNLVKNTLLTGTRTPATDFVTVHAATPYDYSINAELTLLPGPDSSVVVDTANTALDKFIDLVSHLGYDVNQSALYAALHQSGVQRVNLITPTVNLVLPASQYARCISRTVTPLEYRDV